MTKDEIIKQVHKTIDDANRLFNLDLTYPTIQFTLRGRTSGRVWCAQNLIKFNPKLAETNSEKFYQTAIHEVAHIVHRRLYPNERRAHCQNFYKIDIMLGGRGTRCHSYDTSAARNTRTYTSYVFKCACRDRMIGKKKHYIDVMRGILSCNYCKTVIQYTGELIKTTK